jgi:serine/threonine protein phosphatase 1
MELVPRLPPTEELVFLGDYIDRGPDSVGVVKYLKGLAGERPCRFLKGNHEQMMLDAVRDSREITMWLINGGEQTLASYGLSVAEWRHAEDRAEFLKDDLEFYQALEIYHEDEENIFVHAGLDVAVPDMMRQDPKVLLWVRDKFIRGADQWGGKMILFGHTPTRVLGLKGKEIFIAGRVRGIDTGCCYGGYLTAYDAKSGELYQARSQFKY